jgi:branched-chain amino acid aminotransferase
MMMSDTITIPVTKNQNTSYQNIDIYNCPFGKIHTDHMMVCDFKDGTWQMPEIVPFKNFEMSPFSRVFHYGQAIFEGMKAYKDAQDDIWLFRPDENQKRFNSSAKRMAIPELPEEFFMEGVRKLVEIEKNWIPKGFGNSLYIRPFIIATEPGILAAPSNEYRFVVIVAPANAYYYSDVKVVIAERYSRAANGGVGAAKVAGNYGAQFYPTQLAIKEGYQQIIWTDDVAHKYLEESGTMNVFFRINDTLITAPTSDRILDGVTRKSLITLAKHQGIKVEERPISVDELKAAYKTGELKEIFGAGTAAVITPIISFAHQNIEYPLNKQADSFALKLKQDLLNIQYNVSEDLFGWRQKV